MAKNLEFVFMALFHFRKSWTIKVEWLRVDFQRIVSIVRTMVKPKQNPQTEADKLVRDIKRVTRWKFSAEEKIRIVFVG
jgi:hypothetical protein